MLTGSQPLMKTFNYLFCIQKKELSTIVGKTLASQTMETVSTFEMMNPLMLFT